MVQLMSGNTAIKMYYGIGERGDIFCVSFILAQLMFKPTPVQLSAF